MSNLQPATYRNANNRQTEEQLGLAGYPFVGAAAWSATNLQYQSLLVDSNGNLQVSGGITGIFNENLTQVGGAAYSLGQKAMAASMPMVIASDQSEVAVKSADGSLVTVGAVTDAAVVTDANGTLSGKMRGMVKILASARDSVVGALKITLASNGEVIDANNSSAANIAVGVPASYVGTPAAILNYAIVQVNLKADQNCLVYVDQGDGTNWDISDPFEYFASTANFGIPVALTNSAYRVRVVNVGTATTTVFRLRSVLCPVHNVLPRNLSVDGYLQCTVNNFQDDSAFVQNLSPFGEVIANPLFRVAGSIFPGSVLDTNFWTAAIGVGGTVTPINGLVTISTGTTANNAVSLTSVYQGRFVGGYPNKTRQLYTLGDTGTANNVRQWGMGDAATPSNGAFFELNGTTFNLVTMKAGVRTVVANGTFNGLEGLTSVVDTLPHFYEILYTPQTIWWYIDQELVHTSNFTSTWCSTMNLFLIHTNTNSGGSTANVSAFVSVSLIMREGLQNVQAVSKIQQGVTTGITFKTGAGVLHRGIISNITNNATVTIYDNTTASGTVIWASGTMGAQTIPFPMDFGDVEFGIGLTLVVTIGANVYLAFE